MPPLTVSLPSMVTPSGDTVRTVPPTSACTVLGVIFLAMVYNAFNMSGINTYWQDVVLGVMLLSAVFLGEYLNRRRIAR